MGKIKYLLFLLSMLPGGRLMANHVAGGYFEYTYISSDTYQIDFYWLRDCSGQNVQNPVLYRKSDCGGACTSLGTMAQIGGGIYTDYGCGNTCNSTSSKPGYELYHFRKTVTLPSICDSWTFSVAISIRNDVDFMIGGGYYYNYCRINNNYNNSSPTVSGNNIIVGCKDYVAYSQHSFSATDGDQLVYDIVAPYDGYYQTCDKSEVVYESGYNAARPFPSSTDMALNTSTGEISFTPTAIGRSYYAIRVREYRNSVLIGETMVDGMMYAENCNIGDHATFGSFSESGTSLWDVPNTEQHCESVLISSEDDLEVTNVFVSAPDYVTYTISDAGGGRKLVQLCVNFPEEFMCQEMNVGVVISAAVTGVSCVGMTTSGGDHGYYTIHKERGQYCPENLFFTNRNPNGNIMPSYSIAQDRIWVGDDMPLGLYDPFNDGPEGPVIANTHVTLVAGNQVILPSCVGGVSTCVVLNKGYSIFLKPNSCSTECDQIPLDVYVHEIFECESERLTADVTGDGPFTYQWNIDDSTFTTTSETISVHDIISQIDGTQIPYTVEVFDAVGQSGTFSGMLLGTKRFYEPILNNKIYFDYESGSPLGDPGYYYSANLSVFTDAPAFFVDSVNTTPPWYGATAMSLRVWNRWGELVMEKNVDLEGTDDWSMDNGEFYWNGKIGNSPVGDCLDGSLTDFFPYTLTNRNCYNIGSHLVFDTAYDETASLLIFSCLDEPWIVVETKSMGNEFIKVKKTGDGRIPEMNALKLTSESVSVFPVPMTDEIEILSSDENLENIIIIDQTGKVVLTLPSVQSREKISVKHLGSGIYILTVKTDFGEKRIKLVKN